MHALISRRLKYVYAAGLILSLHQAFTIYVNSSFLNQFFSQQEISLLYIYGSLLAIIGLIASSGIIKRYGNTVFMMTALVLEIVALVSLYKSTDLFFIKLFFIIHHALPVILLFSMDIFVEGAHRGERLTGKVRSLYLTLLNASFVVSPLFIGLIVSYFGYRTVYSISAACCCILLFLVADYLRTIPTRALREVNFLDSIRKYLPHTNLNRLFIINFLLQSFFAVMVIYTPLYLHTSVGFSWKAIGFIFTVMLVPFVLFEAPLGRLFDKTTIEKDTMIAGFIIMALSTATIFFLHKPHLVSWMIVLFITRMGASFVEVSSDYAFFKRVSEQDAGFISIFKMAVPLSYISAPLIIAPLTTVIPLQYVFLCIAVIMLAGTVFSYKL